MHRVLGVPAFWTWVRIRVYIVRSHSFVHGFNNVGRQHTNLLFCWNYYYKKWSVSTYKISWQPVDITNVPWASILIRTLNFLSYLLYTLNKAFGQLVTTYFIIIFGCYVTSSGVLTRSFPQFFTSKAYCAPLSPMPPYPKPFPSLNFLAQFLNKLLQQQLTLNHFF